MTRGKQISLKKPKVTKRKTVYLWQHSEIANETNQFKTWIYIIYNITLFRKKMQSSVSLIYEDT